MAALMRCCHCRAEGDSLAETHRYRNYKKLQIRESKTGLELIQHVEYQGSMEETTQWNIRTISRGGWDNGWRTQSKGAVNEATQEECEWKA